MYLSQAIESVIHQTIGFKDNIQLILVNDGSTDGSENICLRYQKQYPENVIYCRKANGGLSSARNYGLRYVQGKYVNFLDSDDWWTTETFELVYTFFEKNYEKIDVVGCRIKFFEGDSHFHPLDYKFKRSRVVNLRREPNCFQLSGASSFVKVSSIHDIRFCEELHLSEDFRFLNTIILQTCQVGVIREALYMYRKRFTSDSLIQLSHRDLSFYTTTPTLCYQYLINLSKLLYGQIVPFIQHAVMYDLQWRIRQTDFSMLSTEQHQNYCSLLVSFLQCIDDRIILEQRNLCMHLKLLCLSKKYDYDVRRNISYDRGKICLGKRTLLDITKEASIIEWVILDIRNGTLCLEGKDKLFLAPSVYSFVASCNNLIFPGNITSYPLLNVKSAFGTITEGHTVKFNIPLPLNETITIGFEMIFADKHTRVNISFGKFSHIPTGDGYFATDSWIVKASDASITVIPYKRSLHWLLEMRYLGFLLRKGLVRIAFYRTCYWICKPFSSNYWLISDRFDRADDNGKHLFQYIQERPRENKEKILYCIQKHSPDYHSMKALGPILDMNSMKYRLHFLLADKVISSHADDYFTNPFFGDKQYLSDLYQFEYIFLQHGVTKDDQSEWLHRLNKNIRLLVTSAQQEYNSFLEGSYGYPNETIKLLGFPRHDRLQRFLNSEPNNKTSQVLILPTWRKHLFPPNYQHADKFVYYPKFNRSEYFRQYNSLINNAELLKAMQSHGYVGLFALHPNYNKNYIDFQSNTVFRVNPFYVDYQSAFIQSSILITDYSSVAFDFAYLRKPIIYFQFDSTDFFTHHLYKKGYFDYERDGFGRVCRTADCVIKSIIDLLQNGSTISPLFLQRASAFYAFRDTQNAERVYQAILNIRNNKRPTLLTFNNIFQLLFILYFSTLFWFRRYITHNPKHTFLYSAIL